MMTGNTKRVLTVRITLKKHKSSDLLVAMSHDLPGLYVAARTEEQIEAELPGAIRELLEAEGKTGVEVSPAEPVSSSSAFDVRTRIFNAELEMA